MVDGLLENTLSTLGSESVLLFLIIFIRTSKRSLPTTDYSFSVFFFCYCLETVYLLKKKKKWTLWNIR